MRFGEFTGSFDLGTTFCSNSTTTTIAECGSATVRTNYATIGQQVHVVIEGAETTQVWQSAATIPPSLAFPFLACDIATPFVGVVKTNCKQVPYVQCSHRLPPVVCSHRFHIPISRILNKMSYDLAVTVAYKI
jgi:hypothetical protein